LVTAAAGLNEGVISKEDGSVRDINTRRNLDDAIAFSDNGYFQRVGSELGNTKLVEYGRQLGLGQPTGINLDGEAPGRLPYSNSNARIYSHGDDTEVSTLQLAVMVSAITNGGNRVLPRIPRNAYEQTKFQPFYKAKVEVPQQNIRRMIPGMMGTAEYGTARRGVDASLGIAGKTGSCIDKGSWVGLFASVAPIESPKYAVAVITRGQSERGKYAAAVAGKVYQALSRNIVRTDRNLAWTEFKIASKAPAAVANTADDEDEDETDASAAASGSNVASDEDRPVVVVGSAPRIVTIDRPAPKKLVQNTVTSKPVFKPVIITVPTDPSQNTRERVVQPNQ
jgi:membrane peptidoglycan carboxypeptidase